jgi:uncharacterized protein (TIGR00251 family)
MTARKESPPPETSPLRLVAKDDGLSLAVKVVPGSSRQRIVGSYGDGIKITVRAAAEGGAANQAVLSVLADALQIAPANLRIIRGHTNPRKEVLIVSLSAETIRQRLVRQ